MRAVVETPSVSIEYPRLGRWQTGERIVLRLPQGENGRTLLLSRGFSKAFELVGAQPEPVWSEAGPDVQFMLFSLDRGGPASVVLHVRALDPGVKRYGIGVGGGRLVSLRTVVLP